ncbi:hypothetical protein Fmac_017489 [Flemingia macrophylla]|uniref:Uncharacterized protein n=1 Tax=Flemingia macrophylla TaxID=520843 RepID=A0ABD1M294_9FABA
MSSSESSTPTLIDVYCNKCVIDDEDLLKLQWKDMTLVFLWPVSRVRGAFPESITQLSSIPTSCSVKNAKAIATLIELSIPNPFSWLLPSSFLARAWAWLHCLEACMFLHVVKIPPPLKKNLPPNILSEASSERIPSMPLRLESHRRHAPPGPGPRKKPINPRLESHQSPPQVRESHQPPTPSGGISDQHPPLRRIRRTPPAIPSNAPLP